MGKKKVKSAPKKSKMITGYIIYASEIRKEIIAANPEKNFGDISKIVGFEWKKLGQEQKVMFEKRAEEQNCLFREEFSKMTELANEALVNAANAAAAAGVAPDLDKLADVAAERAASEETQQQQQQQHEAFIGNQQPQQQQLEGSFVNNTNQDNSFMSTTNQEHQQQSFMSSQDNQQQQQQQNQQQAHQQQQSQLRSPLPPNVMSQYASSVANYNASAAYSQQQTAYYSQLMMGQSTPALARPPYSGAAAAAAANDLLLQQQQHQQQQQPPPQPMGPALPQQPYSIVQHSQPTTNVQYCNNPACCASGRYQPYPPYPYSPPESSVSPSSFQQQLVESSPALQAIQQEQQKHLYKMNNIIYRKPSQVTLRPKDAGTQTDPMPWAGKLERESPKKQQLRFSKEFIQHMSLNRLGGTPTKITAECHW